jgi:hypothetical protein
MATAAVAQDRKPLIESVELANSRSGNQMPAPFVALLGICAAVGSVLYGIIRWIKDAGQKRRIKQTAAPTLQRSPRLRASTGRLLFGRNLSTATPTASMTQEK